MAEKLIITAALNGTHPRKEINPYVPYTPDEIAKAGIEAVSAGASILHIHTRSADGAVDHRAEVFVDVIKRIRERSDAVISVTTGAGGRISPKERIGAIVGAAEAGAAPELGEVNLGSLDLDFIEDSGKLRFGDYIFQNTYATVREFVDLLQSKGMKPAFAAWDAGQLANLEILLKSPGLLKAPVFLDLCYRGGQAIGGLSPSRRNLFFAVDSIQKLREYVNVVWEVIIIGMPPWELATYAILEGGHVRVGLEDYAFMAPGKIAKGSGEMVSKVRRLAEELGRSVATPAEARKILGI